MNRFVACSLIVFIGLAPVAEAAVKAKGAIDINTIELVDGKRVHLLGVSELPAELQSGRGNELKFLDGLVKERQVELEFDEPAMAQADEPWAYVWFEVFPESHLIAPEDLQLPRFYELQRRPDANGNQAVYVLLNATVIKAGYAAATPIPANRRYSVLFQDLYYQVQSNYFGLCHE